MWYLGVLICLGSVIFSQQPGKGDVSATDISGSVQASSGKGSQESSPEPVPEPTPSTPADTQKQQSPKVTTDTKQVSEKPVAAPKVSEERKKPVPSQPGKRVPAFWIILPER